MSHIPGCPMCGLASDSMGLYCNAGLGGELREVGRMEQRLAEAAKLGFTTFVIPATHAKPTNSRLADVRIIRCKHVMEALKAVLGTGKSVASTTLAMPGSTLQDPFDDDDSDF